MRHVPGYLSCIMCVSHTCIIDHCIYCIMYRVSCIIYHVHVHVSRTRKLFVYGYMYLVTRNTRNTVVPVPIGSCITIVKLILTETSAGLVSMVVVVLASEVTEKLPGA